MHIAFDIAQAGSPIPLLHIIDVTAEAILARKLTTVGLLGTRITCSTPSIASGWRPMG